MNIVHKVQTIRHKRFFWL